MTGEGKFFTKLQFYKSLYNGRHYSYDQIPNLTNKVALVTGANQGVGYATTLALVAHGAHVVMACRSEAKANDAIEQLHKDVAETYPRSTAAVQITKGERLKLEFLELDLNDLKKTQKSAQEFLSRGLPLHILINNSGIAGDAWTLSADGIENQFAVNHLGHFVFTLALLDRLKESQPSKIVIVSSLAYETLPPGGFDLSTINDETVGDPMSRYGRSKYATLLFGKALASRLESEQVFVNIVHPGMIKTRMGNTYADNMEPSIRIDIMKKISSAGSISVADGALTQLYCATSPEINNKNIRGKFFIPIAHELDPMPEVESKELQEQLWTYSEEVVKQKLNA
ncbi:Retinol dehydrogenase 14 [Podila horticola]|nr:Retinol dehydrogenase 14 [Podila horticola]